MAGGLSGFMGAASQAVAGGLMTPEIAKELVLFAARRFRVGEELEEKISQMGQQPPQQQEDPTAAIEQAKLALEREKLLVQKSKIEGDQALEAQKLMLQKAELVQRGQVEGQKVQQKHLEALINRDTARI